MAAGSNDDDLLFRASVDDNTKQFFDDFDKRVDKVSDTASKGFESIGNNVDDVGATIGVLSGLFSALTTKVIEFSVQAIDSFISFLQESTAVTDEIESMTKAFDVVGQNLGYNKKSLDGYVESLTAMDGITRKLAIETLSKLAENEVDLTKVTDLAKVAQDAAAASNMTVAQSFTMITNAIERQSPFMIKRLGLSVDMETAYRREARQLDIQVDQLTKSQKQHALINAILEAGVVVNGAYAASVEGLTAENERQAKIMEEIQLELGNILLPGQLEGMKAYRTLLEDIMKFLKEHHDDLVLAGKDIAIAFQDALEAAQNLSTGLGSVLQSALLLVNTITKDLAPAFGVASDDVDIFKQNLFETFSKAYALARATVAGIDAVSKSLLILDKQQQDAVNRANNPMAALVAAADQNSKVIDVATVYQDAYNKSLKESVDLMNSTADSTDNATDSAQNYANKLANDLAAAVEDATAKLEKLKEAQDLQAADLARQAQRQAIEQQLRDQWAEEDRVRNHEEGIQQILENSQEAKTSLAKKASDTRVQIEKDYTKRLQAIQDQFEFDSDELIRKRDAVGLLALIRQNKHQLEKEKDAQEERRKEAQANYEKALKDIDEATQKQLKKYEEAYAKQLEDVQRNLDRQKQLKQLHDKWAQEDRDRALQKQLEDIIKSFMAMDGATKDGLSQLLKDWGWYFGELGGIISQYYGVLASAYSFPTTVGNGVNHSPGSPGNYGQAGQVSQMLSPDYLNEMSPASLGNVSRLPVAPASTSNSTLKVIRFEGSVEGLDPYIQRVMVKSLLEIERNNNG